MNEILKGLVNHNRYQIATILVALGLVFWTYGCPSKVKSLLPQGGSVTRSGLKAEVDFYLARAQVKFKQLDRQDEFKRIIINNALVIAETGSLNPAGLVMAALGILGTGAAVDNVRRRRKRNPPPKKGESDANPN